MARSNHMGVFLWVMLTLSGGYAFWRGGGFNALGWLPVAPDVGDSQLLLLVGAVFLAAALYFALLWLMLKMVRRWLELGQRITELS